ncbi:uncharacterized protein N0V89_010119 [Didymosphaeria variabile]|uniref:Uncharacterized protein n=1 Tax=Didymosphaeria variabile TaxID=1932322 RepID=A0A9W8XGF0_9PLEO|nr:uncharacterized protein N0V89_010119 [Didymosphaeria variabile]KAJ4348741.1 hypothetical protein N0V89_010119 [Didymosphaeria variabile]
MDPHEQPWSEHEKVNLLAEVLLKAGTSPSRVLFSVIRDSGVQVRWNDLVLPNGRSLGSCHRAFDDLAAQALPSEYRHPVPPPTAPIMYPGGREIPQKRPHPESYTPIQPRPSQPTYMGMPNQPPYASTIPPVGEPANKKKRGRPPKAVTEMRRQEALSKGEPYPPPRKSRPSITARDPSQASPGGPLSYAQTPPSASLPAPTGATTPQGTQPPEPSTESSSGKKKQKPAPLELGSPPELYRPATDTQSAVFSNFTPNSAPFSSSPKKSSEPHIPHLHYGSQGPSPRQSLGSESRDVRMEGVEETQPRTTTPHSFKDTVGI